MLKAIKIFFEQHMTTELAADTQEHQLRLATAALLVEMMNQDEKVLEAEKQVVRQSLKDNFNLNDEESSELYQLAHEELNNATDYYQFTKLIAAYFSQPQKIKMIELLWQVAYADNHLDAYEEHMVRRIADLIYVPHHDFIQTKLRVQKKQS
ncbi:MAG: TerB family tellurite resistance protein [gamma proteobacterium symbiont of Bathyaustriella thionipta]|nr:TerB family tellurite resistance protein [gamma proteobacterium symbiont of Bathyaustriella thionipta]MCU7951451.1 TerB family tellurite resistance protein [gamma proteobacterium symbiont of Bathyaustriella thionipta]MCU7953629.1 TerB family tellurite resistance protein [gamma proteobacterium symbiont of Bathyaustriella thionipta]MCU7958019.1 TerB family tellurite resistance protein [gamma proteobacterium symbiont of Bathyaustriella thionipta]